MRVGFVHESWLANENLGVREIGFLATLATYANQEGLCWPSHCRLAQDLKTIPKVIKAIIRKISEVAPEVLEVIRTAKGYRYRLIGHDRLFTKKDSGSNGTLGGGSNGTPNTSREHPTPLNPPSATRRRRRPRTEPAEEPEYQPPAVVTERQRRETEAFKEALEAKAHSQEVSCFRMAEIETTVRIGGPPHWWETQYPPEVIERAYRKAAKRLGVPWPPKRE